MPWRQTSPSWSRRPTAPPGVPTTPTLAARVTNPGGGSLTARVSLRRTPAEEFTIIVLPDTQHYSEAFPAVFTSQTQWIVDNKDARNIVFVTHEGDIVEHNDLPLEWDRANTSMSLLEAANMPFGMGPGNHDQPTTLYNQYFPVHPLPGTLVLRRALSGQERQQLPALLGRRHGLRHRPPGVLSADGGRRMGGVRHGRAPRAHRHHDDARVSERVGAALGAQLHQYAVPVGSACGAQPESSLHAERPRPQRVETDRHRGRPHGVPDAGRLPGSRERRRRLAAHPALRPRRRQGVRADVFAMAERVRDRRQQRVHARFPDGRRLRGRRHGDRAERV